MTPTDRVKQTLREGLDLYAGRADMLDRLASDVIAAAALRPADITEPAPECAHDWVPGTDYDDVTDESEPMEFCTRCLSTRGVS